VIQPGMFKTRPCPGYAGIDLAIKPKKELTRLLDQWQPEAIHIATEGPLGWAARSYCLKHKLAFTTAFHTKFPEILNAAAKIPLSCGYALFRHFHRRSSGVMVPTQGVLRMLEQRGFRNLRSWTHGVDMSLFEFHDTVQTYPGLGELLRPVALFVGRVSYEKNIEVFLRMDFPGTKLVCGVGPLEASLKTRFPKVRWLGLLKRDELARVYASADIFAFPSRSETFGLVMLEAMACGTPVAAYPVDGPLEVLGQTLVDGSPGNRGGALHEDLRHACYSALSVSRHEARNRALEFSWMHATRLFVSHLVQARPGAFSAADTVVTPMSSN
jgi:glycosyltransferase involved in cell wall biosynthesis